MTDENGALDPWSLNLRFWGAPIFSPEAPKPLFWRVSERFGAKSGAPQTQIQRPRIQRPILGPLTKGDGPKVTDLVARAIRNAIRANRFARIIRNSNPYFYSASGRFARITRISDSRESADSRESCELIRANHATKALTEPNLCGFLRFAARKSSIFSAKICGFLRPPNAWISKRRGESAKICGFLRKSAFWAPSVTLGPSP